MRSGTVESAFGSLGAAGEPPAPLFSLPNPILSFPFATGGYRR